MSTFPTIKFTDLNTAATLSLSDVFPIVTYDNVHSIYVNEIASIQSISDAISGSITASYALFAQSASNSTTSSVSNVALSSSYSTTASLSNFAQSASNSINAATASIALVAQSASYLTTPFQVPLTFSKGLVNTSNVVTPSPWKVVSSSYTASVGDRIQANTLGGTFSIALPASASVGDSLQIADATLNWNNANLIIAPNGLNINGLYNNYYTASVQGNDLSVVYISTGYGWSIK